MSETVRPSSPVWADGPSGGLETELVEVGLAEFGPDFSPSFDDLDEDVAIATMPTLGDDAELADHLAAARILAEKAHGARLNSRAALYRALGLAYDFALLAEDRPDDYTELLADAGVKVQARAPMTAIVKLVFGPTTDKARATEFAAALSCARRIGLTPGSFASHVEGQPGGLKSLVAAERVARRPADALPSHTDLARAALRRAAPQAMLDMPSDAGEFVLLLARREADGRLAVLAPVPAEPNLVDRAIRKITR